MISINNKRSSRKGDSTVALINIVFLMLVFFLIAGTITPPIDNEVNPILVSEEINAELSDMLSVRKEGDLYYRGEVTTLEAFWSRFSTDKDAKEPIVRILVDQDLVAIKLVTIIAELKALGAKTVRIVTKRSAV